MISPAFGWLDICACAKANPAPQHKPRELFPCYNPAGTCMCQGLIKIPVSTAGNSSHRIKGRGGRVMNNGPVRLRVILVYF